MLGPTFERSLRHALTLSDGDPMTFLERPVAAALLAAALAMLVFGLVRRTPNRYVDEA